MKTLHILLILLTVIIFLCFGLGPVHADNTNGISIQNISVQPNTVKVGDSFTITATLVNNSTFPIVVEGGTCVPVIKHVPFFTVILDNHTKIRAINLTCAGVGLSEVLDPEKTITGTSPDSTLTYIATESGTANATVTFSYFIRNQTDSTQPRIEHILSKSLLFTIRDNNTITESLNIGKRPITDKILSPLKQFKSGIKAEDVKCPDGFLWTLKAEDSSPACVKPETAKKLYEHGWALVLTVNIENNTTNTNTSSNTEKNGTLSGNVVLAGGPRPGQQANYEVDVYAADGITIIGKTLSDSNGNYSIQLPAGNYTIYAPDYPTKQTHFVSVISGKNTILNIMYGIGYK